MSYLKRLYEKPLRLPRLSPYVPDPNDPAIFWFNSERDQIVDEVAQRVATSATTREGMELALNDAAIHETRRLSKQRDQEAKDSLGYWRSLARRIGRMSDDEKRKALLKTTSRMSRDIAGNFDSRVYKMSQSIVPRLLTGVMRPSKLPIAVRSGARSTAVDRLLTVEGDVARLRDLQKRGTLVYVPTHSSNLDSIVLGHALEQSGLSPVIYGAGKNLFTNPIISFFMHNLGAYRVDRRVKAALYKDVLKSYSQVMIERGYHSLFFPGGTRSRSGMIENRLKLGLAGSAVNAFANNQVKGVDRRVYFVPTTINYALVLEAETLVEDWLSDEGKARYIIEDDEFSRIDRWVAFFRKLTSLEAACIIRFGEPVDAFGNFIDDEGASLTPAGSSIDPAGYVMQNGKPNRDLAREAAYTRDLGEVLLDRYKKETVLMAQNVVAHVLFRRVVERTDGIDLFSRLRLRGEVSMSREELRRTVGETRDRLLEMQDRGAVRVSPFVADASPDTLIDRSLRVWSGYHSRVAARDLGVEVTAEDPTLLLYYQNRLVPFAEDVAGAESIAAAREIGAMGVRR